MLHARLVHLYRNCHIFIPIHGAQFIHLLLRLRCCYASHYGDRMYVVFELLYNVMDTKKPPLRTAQPADKVIGGENFIKKPKGEKRVSVEIDTRR